MVCLQSAEDVARYCFLAHKSVSYLDLSTCELSQLAKTTYTMEGFQKMNGVSGRNVIYSQHLDVSSALEKPYPVTSLIPDFYPSRVYRDFTIDKSVYFRCLLPGILKMIKNSNDKLAELKRFLRPMEMVGLNSYGFYSEEFSFFANIFRQENCTDSKLIIKFVTDCGRIFFSHWLLMDNVQSENMKFFLYHAQKLKFEMFLKVLFCPTSQSLFGGMSQHTIHLIKYGKTIKPATDREVRRYVHYSSMFR